MRVEFDFTEVIEKLDYITSIVEDNVDDTMKNVIFRITKDNVKLIGYNDFAICKYALDEVSISDFNSDEKFIQIKAKEFSGLLKTLASSRRTKVEKIYFEDKDNKLKLTIEEGAISEDIEYSEYLEQKSFWYFDILGLRESTLRDVRENVNVELEGVVSKDIRLYIDALAPLLTGERGSTSNKLYFGKDFVYVIPRICAVLFENNLRDEFRNISLTGQSVKFLTKVLTGNELVELGRTEKYLVIKSDNFEVYMRYQNVLPPIENYLNAIASRDMNGQPVRYSRSEDPAEKLQFINRDNGIVFDKIYLQDVLKRFSLIDDKVVISIQPDKKVINLSNAKHNLDVPLIAVKGMSEFGKLEFRMAPSLFSQTLFGGDDIFTTEMFMYFIKRERGGYNIANTDSTGAWFTILQIKTEG